MIRFVAFLSLFMSATVLNAQDIEVTPLEPLNLETIIEEVIEQDKAEVATVSTNRAVIRGIDKLDGTVDNLEIIADLPIRFGTLSIALTDCRYPEDNPSGEAFAFLEISDSDEQVFRGWMIASSPALNSLDHQRFDVWVLRCSTSEADGG